MEEVYEAVVNPDQLSAYFTTGGAKGRIEKGATVMWSYHDFPGEFPVEVIDAIPNEKIVLDWEATDEDGIAVDKPGADCNIRMTMELGIIYFTNPCCCCIMHQRVNKERG